MRFKVTRTTSRWHDQQPCAGARKGPIESWDYRTFKTPEEFNELGGDWFGEDTCDHGSWTYDNEPAIKRRRSADEEAWFIDIETLEDLLAFYDEYGELVLGRATEDRRTPEIEIYDDYRE